MLESYGHFIERGALGTCFGCFGLQPALNTSVLDARWRPKATRKARRSNARKPKQKSAYICLRILPPVSFMFSTRRISVCVYSMRLHVVRVFRLSRPRGIRTLKLRALYFVLQLYAVFSKHDDKTAHGFVDRARVV